MIVWLRNFVWRRTITLLLALIVVSFLLFPVSQRNAFTRWLNPVANAQVDVVAVLKDLIERTGLYESPRRGTAPTGRRVGGAGRGPICTLPNDLIGNEQTNQIKALIPFQSVANPDNDPEQPDIKVGADTEFVGGLTIAPQPTFWFYIPYVATELSSKRVSQFVLLDGTQRPVWNELITIELRDRPQLVEYVLPYTLATDTLYNWYFSVICDSEKLSRNPIVRGWVERTEPSPELQLALQTTPLFEQYIVYANGGIWFDMMASLVDIRRQFPYTNRDSWTVLLNHFGLANSDQLDVLDAAVPVDREEVSGNQLPARM